MNWVYFWILKSQVVLERLLAVPTGSSGITIPKRKPSESGCSGGALIRTGLLGGPRSSRQAALCKLQELQRCIDGWEWKEAGPACNEFICEGLINKVGAGKRQTERYAFLFDGLLLLCKPCGHGRRSSAASPGGEYRLKEKFFIRKVISSRFFNPLRVLKWWNGNVLILSIRNDKFYICLLFFLLVTKLNL